MLRRLPIVACALALAALARPRRLRQRRGAGIDEPAREGLADRDRRHRLHRLHHARAQPADHAGQGLLPRRGAARPGPLRDLRQGVQQATSRAPTAERVHGQGQPGQQVPARAAARVDNAFAYRARRRSTPRSASPRRAASPSSARRPARCCCSSSRCENTENRPLELEIKADDGEKRTLRAGHLASAGLRAPRLRRRRRRRSARSRPDSITATAIAAGAPARRP